MIKSSREVFNLYLGVALIFISPIILLCYIIKALFSINQLTKQLIKENYHENIYEDIYENIHN